MDINNFNATDKKAGAIADWVEQIFELYFAPKGNNFSCYCGITNDVKGRMQKHISDKDFDIWNDTVYSWECSDADVAAEVEGELGRRGFDIGRDEQGGNGRADDSVYVYLLKKA